MFTTARAHRLTSRFFPRYKCDKVGMCNATKCPPGTFVTCEGKASCDQCPAGRYCPVPTSSLLCPAGSYCPVDSSAPATCPAGFYCPLGADQPLPCPQSSETGLSECVYEPDERRRRRSLSSGGASAGVAAEGGEGQVRTAVVSAAFSAAVLVASALAVRSAVRRGRGAKEVVVAAAVEPTPAAADSAAPAK
jgi:hypothetical protein